MTKTAVRTDCTPEAEIPVKIKSRKYTGPPKGSEEAKARMAKVRAAQWAKHGIVLGSDGTAKLHQDLLDTARHAPAVVRD